MSPVAAAVAFHTGVSNPIEHAVRLCRKAAALGSRVLVIGPEPIIGELDECLWTADPSEFLAHARWTVDTESASRVRHARLWLCSDGGAMPTPQQPEGPEVMINLGLPVPSQASAYAKVIEVVPTDGASRSQGQERWRFWRSLGLTPTHHSFS